MEFIPVIVALLSAFIGVVGNTWNPHKSGIWKVTTTGWMVVVLAVVSFGYGAWILQDKNRQISQRAEIRIIAHTQIVEGIDFLTRHLRLDNSGLRDRLKQLTDSNHQDEIGKDRLVHFPGLEGGIVSDGVDGRMGGYREVYELYDANIEYGKNLLNDVLIKYVDFLDPSTIIEISQILHNKFFLNEYKFSKHKDFFELGLLNEKEHGVDKSPWNYLGLFYFNAVYWGDSQRKGDNTEFNGFIMKLQTLFSKLDAIATPNKKIQPTPKSGAAD